MNEPIDLTTRQSPVFHSSPPTKKQITHPTLEAAIREIQYSNHQKKKN